MFFCNLYAENIAVAAVQVFDEGKFSYSKESTMSKIQEARKQLDEAQK